MTQPELKPVINNNNSSLHADQIAREYQDFAYIVSHDLNAPLRHVKEFTRLLIGGRIENLTEEEQEYVRFLEQSLAKLDDMQMALLTFSRLNTHAGEMREVDFNKAVAAAISELGDVINLHQPVIEYDNLPTINAEPRQIELLFLNLVDNALKFHTSDTPKRKVSLTAMDKGENWLFEVKDNGIGIDEKFHNEVFRMFKRLKPDRYPGIGAGLTNARKIVQRHNGDVMIKSEPGAGTSVLFSLPKS